MTFPISLDSLSNPTSSDNQGAFGHANLHSLENDAIEALEAKVGVDNSAVTTSLDYLVKSSSSVNPGHKHPVSALTQDSATLNQAILWNGSSWAPGTPAGGGNVIGAASSVDSEIALYSGTSGTTIKRMTGTGLVKVTSGVASIASPGTDYAPATSGIGILKGNGTGGTSTASAGTDYVTPTGGETLTNKTLTSPTITTPVINIGSDVDGDTYFRNAGTTKRLPIGTENSFYVSDGAIPYWDNPFTYSGTYINDSTSATGAGNTFSTTTRLINDLTIANVALSGPAGSAYLEQHDGSGWTTLFTTNSSMSFPILLRKGYSYRVTASATVNGPTSTVSINYIL